MDTIVPVWLWVVFVAIVLAALFVDFVVLKKQGAHEVGVREALNWSVLWVALSLAFNGLLWWAVKDTTGSTAIATEKSLEFLTGYLIEKSLAVDNIFVFLMIFTYFAVPPAYQKRVLMIGIIRAIVLRTIMILVGAWLLEQFHWVLYVFGAFLILTGIKMWWAAGKEASLDDNPALKLLRKVLPVSKQFDGEKFWTVENGKKIATPLLMVIALVALTDVIFAVDSIPAIFAITKDPFIVLTSNVLPAAGGGQPLPPAELRPGGDPGLHRHQDDADRHLQDSGGGVAGRGARHPGHHDGLERQDRAQHLSLPHPRPGGLCWPVGAPTGACRPFFR